MKFCGHDAMSPNPIDVQTMSVSFIADFLKVETAGKSSSILPVLIVLEFILPSLVNCFYTGHFPEKVTSNFHLST